MAYVMRREYWDGPISAETELKPFPGDIYAHVNHRKHVRFIVFTCSRWIYYQILVQLAHSENKRTVSLQYNIIYSGDSCNSTTDVSGVELNFL